MNRDLVVAVFFAVTCMSAGCSDRPPAGPIPCFPVTGSVTFKGKPLADATVAFIPRDAAPVKPGDEANNPTPNATGKTNAEGKFTLHTYAADDGAPIGSYLVSVVYAGVGDSRDLLSTTASPNMLVKLPTKYADPKQSGLEATVKEGPNQISEFVLK